MIRAVGICVLFGAMTPACSQGAASSTNGGTPDADSNCEGRGDDYFAGMKKPAPDGALTVELTSIDPAPPANVDTNTWAIKLASQDGSPIVGATIVGAPFMIDHGHSASSQIAADLGAGNYSLGPLALRMNGLWQITLKITPAGGAESDVMFPFCIRPN